MTLDELYARLNYILNAPAQVATVDQTTLWGDDTDELFADIPSTTSVTLTPHVPILWQKEIEKLKLTPKLQGLLKLPILASLGPSLEVNVTDALLLSSSSSTPTVRSGSPWYIEIQRLWASAAVLIDIVQLSSTDKTLDDVDLAQNTLIQLKQKLQALENFYNNLSKDSLSEDMIRLKTELLRPLIESYKLMLYIYFYPTYFDIELINFNRVYESYITINHPELLIFNVHINSALHGPHDLYIKFLFALGDFGEGKKTHEVSSAISSASVFYEFFLSFLAFKPTGENLAIYAQMITNMLHLFVRFIDTPIRINDFSVFEVMLTLLTHSKVNKLIKNEVFINDYTAIFSIIMNFLSENIDKIASFNPVILNMFMAAHAKTYDDDPNLHDLFLVVKEHIYSVYCEFSKPERNPEVRLQDVIFKAAFGRAMNTAKKCAINFDRVYKMLASHRDFEPAVKAFFQGLGVSQTKIAALSNPSKPIAQNTFLAHLRSIDIGGLRPDTIAGVLNQLFDEYDHYFTSKMPQLKHWSVILCHEPAQFEHIVLQDRQIVITIVANSAGVKVIQYKLCDINGLLTHGSLDITVFAVTSSLLVIHTLNETQQEQIIEAVIKYHAIDRTQYQLGGDDTMPPIETEAKDDINASDLRIHGSVILCREQAEFEDSVPQDRQIVIAIIANSLGVKAIQYKLNGINGTLICGSLDISVLASTTINLPVDTLSETQQEQIIETLTKYKVIDRVKRQLGGDDIVPVIEDGVKDDINPSDLIKLKNIIAFSCRELHEDVILLMEQKGLLRHAEIQRASSLTCEQMTQLWVYKYHEKMEEIEDWVANSAITQALNYMSQAFVMVLADKYKIPQPLETFYQVHLAIENLSHIKTALIDLFGYINEQDYITHFNNALREAVGQSGNIFERLKITFIREIERAALKNIDTLLMTICILSGLSLREDMENDMSMHVVNQFRRNIYRFMDLPIDEKIKNLARYIYTSIGTYAKNLGDGQDERELLRSQIKFMLDNPRASQKFIDVIQSNVFIFLNNAFNHMIAIIKRFNALTTSLGATKSVGALEALALSFMMKWINDMKEPSQAQTSMSMDAEFIRGLDAFANDYMQILMNALPESVLADKTTLDALLAVMSPEVPSMLKSLGDFLATFSEKLAGSYAGYLSMLGRYFGAMPNASASEAGSSTRQVEAALITTVPDHGSSSFSVLASSSQTSVVNKSETPTAMALLATLMRGDLDDDNRSATCIAFLQWLNTLRYFCTERKVQAIIEAQIQDYIRVEARKAVPAGTRALEAQSSVVIPPVNITMIAAYIEQLKAWVDEYAQKHGFETGTCQQWMNPLYGAVGHLQLLESTRSERTSSSSGSPAGRGAQGGRTPAAAGRGSVPSRGTGSPSSGFSVARFYSDLFSSSSSPSPGPAPDGQTPTRSRSQSSVELPRGRGRGWG